MLIEFTVGNFRSFRERETLSLVATTAKAKDPNVDAENTFNIDSELKLLKSVAIYGANGSGKSNFGKALSFFRNFVRSSSRESQSDERIEVEPFLKDRSKSTEPSYFQIVFLLDGKQFRYGFEVNAEEVVSEWLSYVPSTKEAKLFRRGKDGFTISSKFREGKGLEDKTRKNALFLSVAAQFNGKISTEVLRWFARFNVISGLNDALIRRYTVNCIQKERNKDDILSLIKSLDLDIDDIEIEEVPMTEETLPKSMPQDLKDLILRASDPNQSKVRTAHKVFSVSESKFSSQMFDLEHHESEGTKKLFSLAGPLVDTLRNGKVLFIDEFDARLHPSISREIVGLFNSTRTNPKGAQLIFATHDTNLLSNKLFRRDQIWFVEKDRRGSSHLYSLVEIKVRNDSSYENNYIEGRYGAIPFISESRELFEGLDG